MDERNIIDIKASSKAKSYLPLYNEITTQIDIK